MLSGFVMLHPPLLTPAVLCTHVVLMIAAVLVVGRKPIQWAGSAFFLAGCLFLEWFAPVDISWRALMAFGGMAALVASIDVTALATTPRPARLRLLQMLTAGYQVRAGRTRPVLSVRILGRLIVAGWVGGAAFWCLRQMAQSQPPPESAITLGRLVAGIILLYALAEFLQDLAHFCFLASGTAMRPLHDTPIAARSLRDFWGKRWNHAVSAWLNRRIFLPLARRRRPDLGLLCAFLVSGALHAWVAWVALGAFAALELMVFFGLQGVFILAEDRLRVEAWPVPLARVWTLATLLATSPLIICPYLRMVHL
jgi:hypothetical protein